VRERTLSELRAEEDEPQRVAGTAFHALVYGTHPLGRPERGTRESVAALGGEDVRDHHRRFFVPGNTVIAAVSCLAPDRIVPWFERAFADWSGTAPEPPTIPPDPVAVPRRMAIARDSDQVNVMLGHSGIRRDDPDYYGLLVMDHVLGLGPGLTDRLSRRLRDGEGLAYSVWATITKSAAREPGTFMAFIGTSAEQKQRAIDGIVAEIERIRMEPVAAEELENAKSYLTGSFVFGYETAEQLAARLVDLHRHALSFDYPRRFAERVRAVTPEDVLEVARRHLHPEALTIVTVGP
jgi:zinc protease